MCAMDDLITTKQLQELLRVDRTEWLKEVEDVQVFFATFNDRLPHALRDEADSLHRRLLT